LNVEKKQYQFLIHGKSKWEEEGIKKEKKLRRSKGQKPPDRKYREKKG